jgi:hypothetical protein
MAFSTGINTSSQSAGDGIFINTAEIVNALETSEEDKAKGFINDISVTLSLKIPSLQYEKKLSISGKHKWQGNVAINWGSSLKVKFLMQAAGIDWNEVPDDGKLDPAILQQLVGRKIKILDYKTQKVKENGKNHYRTWNRVFQPDLLDFKIKEEFLDQHRKGWVDTKTYQYLPQSSGPSPDIMNGNGTSQPDPWDVDETTTTGQMQFDKKYQ